MEHPRGGALPCGGLERGIRGANQVAGLIDSKMYMAHNMFKDPVNNTPGPNHRKVIYYSSSSGFSGGDFHGTHTAGTFAGDQEPITGSIFRNGMAYKAKIAFTNLNDVWGGDLYNALLGAHNVGARVHSNSWGDDGTTQYTSDCQQIDQYSWDRENGMVAFAVTNLNSLKTPENAKSVLAVGASEQAPNQAQHGSGGAGPTSDGRRKPEVYSPGVGIWSAQNGNPNGYAQATGTSMACPSASGFGLLARQYYSEGWLRTGTANPGDGFEPSGALLRATLMNGSVDMTGIAGYPSNSEGWGRILLDNVLWFAGEQRRTIAWDIRNANGFVTGQTYTGAAISVQTSSLPLRVTMSFTDYPAQVFTNFAAVNDVDLEVVAPDGTVYRGNVFSGGQSTSGGAADIKNSTEMVILNTPEPGIYRIRVKAREINEGGRQGFALVTNGRISPASRAARN
ncbi:MAG: S8 family serine peptidase [Armatimonadetes bacterium]|nr:S8 family serine peptidase [Armatimonadota bacterium]